MPMVAMVPATNEPIAAVASAGPPRPALRHLVAFERGRDRGALARRVDQDRGGRAAVHAAVVDAGEHDERAGGIELEGDRQQQRDGERRADAGQHADRGAEQHADQREQQVHRLQRDGEALGERGEGSMASTSEQPFERPRRQRQGQQLGEHQIDHERRARSRSRGR